MRPSEQNVWLPWDTGWMEVLQRKVPEGPALGWRAEKLPWGDDIRREGRAPLSLFFTNARISISPRQWQAAGNCGVKWVTPAHCLQRCPIGQHVCSHLGIFFLGGGSLLESFLCILGLEDSRRVQWCAVSQQERAKCDHWSAVSGGALACVMEETPEDCFAAITVGSPTSSWGSWFWVNLPALTHGIQILLGL